ncbi:hypothetical protein [Spirulina sp. 06S082]|nr:hypothetical protein [Spirulina sp. 06S082]MEA5468925.1 hypothetical protein [Spirulina sp. 06S082]
MKCPFQKKPALHLEWALPPASILTRTQVKIEAIMQSAIEQ